MAKALLRALCALGIVLISTLSLNLKQNVSPTASAQEGADRQGHLPETGSSRSAAWTSGGPLGGYITCVAVAPSNANVIYAGTEGGVYKTDDGGTTWTLAGIIYKQYSTGVISTEFADLLTLQVAPHNPDIVYAGSTTGIYISQNGGADWTNTWPGIDVQVNAIAVSPANPSHILIGTGDANRQWSSEEIGIYKSTDGGAIWQPKLLKNPGGVEELDSVEALLIDSNDAQIVYAGVTNWSGISPGGLRKSIDGGDSWSPIKVYASDAVYAFAMTPSGHNPATIYAFADGINEEIYASTDQGANWNPLAKPSDAVGAAFFYNSFLVVDPGNANRLYASGPDSLYRYNSTPGSWTEIAAGEFALRPSCMATHSSNSHLFVGVIRAGLFRSTDGGSQWTLAPMLNTYINDLAVHPTDATIAYAAVEGIGFHLAKTTNTGSLWSSLASSETYLSAVAIDPQSPSTVYIGKDRKDYKYYPQNASIYKSVNGGLDWDNVAYTRCVVPPCELEITKILVSPFNSNHILVGAAGREGRLFRTTDGGTSWDNFGDPTTVLEIDPNNVNVIYSGSTHNGWVFRYSNIWGIESVTLLNPPGGSGRVRDIALDQQSRIYIALLNGLWRWDGANWTEYTNLPTDDITAVAVDRTASPNIVYAGTDGMGVYSSNNGGTSWTALNTGLGNLYITELQVGGGNPKVLYAGTEYGGVWTTALSGVPANLNETLFLPLLWRNL